MVPFEKATLELIIIQVVGTVDNETLGPTIPAGETNISWISTGQIMTGIEGFSQSI